MFDERIRKEFRDDPTLETRIYLLGWLPMVAGLVLFGVFAVLLALIGDPELRDI